MVGGKIGKNISESQKRFQCFILGACHGLIEPSKAVFGRHRVILCMVVLQQHSTVHKRLGSAVTPPPNRCQVEIDLALVLNKRVMETEIFAQRCCFIGLLALEDLRLPPNLKTDQD